MARAYVTIALHDRTCSSLCRVQKLRRPMITSPLSSGSRMAALSAAKPSLWWPRRPLATLDRKSRQGRKAATVSVDAGAEVSRRGHRLFGGPVSKTAVERSHAPLGPSRCTAPHAERGSAPQQATAPLPSPPLACGKGREWLCQLSTTKGEQSAPLLSRSEGGGWEGVLLKRGIGKSLPAPQIGSA